KNGRNESEGRNLVAEVNGLLAESSGVFTKISNAGNFRQQLFRSAFYNLIDWSVLDGLAKRQITARVFSISPHARALLLEELGNRGMQSRVAEIMPGTGNHRLETTNQLVLPLSAGIKAGEAFGDSQFHTLVETGFEMQPVELGEAAPVTTVEGIAIDQTECHRQWPPVLPGEHHAEHFRHAFGQQTEEIPFQVGRLAAHMVGVGVAVVDEIPVRLAQLMAATPVEVDALPRNLLPLLAHLLAFARAERIEKVLKITITAIVPVELATEALQPTLPLRHHGVAGQAGEVDMQAR